MLQAPKLKLKKSQIAFSKLTPPNGLKITPKSPLFCGSVILKVITEDIIAGIVEVLLMIIK